MNDKRKLPRGADPGALYAGFGEAMSIAAEFMTAIGVWAAIGWGLDTAFGTWPILFAIGAVVGNGAGIYLMIRRTKAVNVRGGQAQPPGR